MKSQSPHTSPSLGGDRGGLGNYIPDFQSRYFTEDFPYGLAIVRQQMQEHRMDAPNIEKVYQWGLPLTSQQSLLT